MRLLTATEFARRVTLRGDGSRSWFALTPATSHLTAKRFSSDFQELTNQESLAINVSRSNPAHIVAQVKTELAANIFLYGFSSWTVTDWEDLDLLRSGMERSGNLFFWLTGPELSKLTSHSPNIRSFIGNSEYSLMLDFDQISDTDREKRLQELRNHFEMSDEKVIELARAAKLPANPSYAEWLILLGRGDLF